MPTLRYEIEAICQNCYKGETLSLPKGTRFLGNDGKLPSRIIRSDGTERGRSCTNCGCYTLVIDFLAQPDEKVLQKLTHMMQMGGGNAKT